MQTFHTRELSIFHCDSWENYKVVCCSCIIFMNGQHQIRSNRIHNLPILSQQVCIKRVSNIQTQFLEKKVWIVEHHQCVATVRNSKRKNAKRFHCLFITSLDINVPTPTHSSDQILLPLNAARFSLFANNHSKLMACMCCSSFPQGSLISIILLTIFWAKISG